MQRSVVFVSLLLGWSFNYLCQRTLSLAMAAMIHQDSETTGTAVFTKRDLGKLQTCFAVAYACSILVTGFLSDRVNPKFLFCLSILMGSILCLLFPFTEGNVMFSCVVWFLLGLFLASGWPACVKILKNWFPREEIGTWWSILSCSSNFSATVSQFTVPEFSNWQNYFFTIGTIALIVAIISTITVQSSPPVSKSTKETKDSSLDHGESTGPKSSAKSDHNGARWYDVFFVFDVWVIALLYVMWWVAKASVMDWGKLYFQEVAMMTTGTAAVTMSVMEIGNTLGKLMVGPLSDWLIRRNKKMKNVSSASIRFKMIFGISILLMILLHGLAGYTSKEANEVWLKVLVFSIGVVVEGGMVLSSLSSMEVVPNHLSGGALGIIIATGQLVGRSSAGWPFSLVVEEVGWNRAYQIIGTLYVVTISTSSYLMLITANRSKKVT